MAAALSGGPAARAQQPLSLDGLKSLAAVHNPTLAQARAQVDATCGKALEAGLYPNPEVGYRHEQIGAEGTSGEFLGGFVRQEVVTGGKLRLSREKYHYRAKVSQMQALAQQYRVFNDVAIHYYRTIGAGRIAAVRRELLKNAEDRLVTTREMFNVGQANEAELHRANVVLQQARLESMMAENDHRMLREQLVAVVGANLQPVPLQDELEGSPQLRGWDQLLSRLYAHSPELAAAWAKYRADQTTLQRERVEPIPNVVLSGAVGRNNETRDTVAGAEVSFEVPLFDRNQGTIRQAEADLRRQYAEIRRMELLLHQRLADQYRRYATALQHVQDYQSIILPEARKEYEVQLKSYQQNRVSWPVVLDSQRAYYQLQVAYVENLVAWRESEVAIDGFLLVDGLAAPLRPLPPGHIDAVPKPR